MNTEITKDVTEDKMSEWEALSVRQKEMAETTADGVMEFGMFKQDSSANGAHYFGGEKNPFKAEGIKCYSCIFFNEYTNQCVVVEGSIDPEGLCKLWVIPEDKIVQEPEDAEMVMKSVWQGSFDPRSVNKIV